jgi:hypothetical protein
MEKDNYVRCSDLIENSEKHFSCGLNGRTIPKKDDKLNRIYCPIKHISTKDCKIPERLTTIDFQNISNTDE